MSSLKAELASARASLEREHRAGARPSSALSAHAAAVDAICAGVFDAAVAHVGRGSAGAVLVAVGGYGRRQLAPSSDLDLMLVHRGWTDDEVKELNRQLMYPLWDSGVEVGNRVRTVAETVAMLTRTDEAMAVLDARPIAGDEALFRELDGAVRRAVERERASILRGLREETTSRHARMGHLGHLLEPDVRESAGGLRDLQSIRWLDRIGGGDATLESLHRSGLVAPSDLEVLEGAEELLAKVRTELHLRAGRRLDVLYLSDQDEVAAAIGYRDQDGRIAGDVLMQELYAHARDVEAILSEAMERCADRPARRRLRGRRSGPRPVGDGCVVRAGRLDVVAASDPRSDPDGWMRVFMHCLEEDALLTRASMSRLRSLLSGAESIPWTPAALSTFLRIVSSGHRSVRVLEAMDAAGFLGALLPQWRHVRCLPQRNLYHRFTVDMHLFAAAAEVVVSRTSDDPVIREAWELAGDGLSVIVAALLHDVGKGLDGDHVVIGRGLAAAAVDAMGLEQDHAEEVIFLVSEHLTLAETAMRRDLEDPAVISEVSARMGDARRLSMLYLLTRADSIATGPEAWSPFRASLVRELYVRTLAALGHDRTPVHAEADPGWAPLLIPDPPAPGEVRTAVRATESGDELVVAARDRPGLLASVAGVLSLRGIEVLSADIRTLDDGTAIESYVVRGTHGPIQPERWDRVRSDLTAAVDGTLDLEAAIRHRAATFRGRRRRARETHVVVTQDAEGRTIVEVHAPDSPGLLHRLARALHAGGCDVHLARVATYGVDAVDVFYVTGPPAEDASTERLKDLLRTAASG
jgi:[protein-PII] uridylyltransferase